MEYATLINRIYDYVEADHIDKAVACCLRLSRLLGDHLNTAVFLREYHAKGNDVLEAMFEDVSHLKKEAVHFIMKHSEKIWLKHHEIDNPWLKDDEGNDLSLLAYTVGEIDSAIDATNSSINLHPPDGMSAYDTAYFWDNAKKNRDALIAKSHALVAVKQRLRGYCLNYAISIEKQLKLQESNDSFFNQLQFEVNNYFRDRSPEVFDRLRKATTLAQSNDVEDYSLLLTSLRRCLLSVADHFLPPSDLPIVCADGQTRVLGTERYLNRLQEYMARSIPTSTSRELLVRELDVIDGFARKLNELASKGVHATVTIREARQGVLGIYTFLYNLIGRLELNAEESAADTNERDEIAK